MQYALNTRPGAANGSPRGQRRTDTAHTGPSTRWRARSPMLWSALLVLSIMCPSAGFAKTWNGNGHIRLQGCDGFGLTVLNQRLKNNSQIILHRGSNHWKMLSNGAIVLKDNPKLGLTVLNQDIRDEAKIILHEGYNLWAVRSDGTIVLKDRPEFGITVYWQRIKQGTHIILHRGYNGWTDESTSAPTRDVTLDLPVLGKRAKVTVSEAKVKGGTDYILQGDIRIPATRMRAHGVGLNLGSNGLWPNGRIPFQLPANHPRRAQIQAAINQLNSATALSLVPRANERDFINFAVPADGNWSYIGRVGQGQEVHVSNASVGTAIHEIMHAAGIYHEQSRTDRDRFLAIHWDNICSENQHNFAKVGSGASNIGTYDPVSVMHYPWNAFAIDRNRPTISTKDASRNGEFRRLAGQRDGLSTGDVATINSLYGASGAQTTPRSGPVTLRSHHGKYVVAEADGRANANRKDAQAWETWTLITNPNGTVSLRSAHGKFLVAEGDGKANANRPHNSTWEKWTLIENNDGTVSLKSHHGLFLVAEADGRLNANRSKAGPWERFVLSWR